MANFRAILAGKKPSEMKAVNCSANVTMEHLKSPFKKDFHSFLGDDLISPIRPQAKDLPSIFTKSESRVNTVETEVYDMPLLSPLQQPKDFSLKTLGLATGLRYVKTADLLFLLEDYTPDKELTRGNFNKMITLLRDSVIGNDAPLPPQMFEEALAQIWQLIKQAQDLYETNSPSVEERKEGEDYANVVVVGPALIVLSKGTMEEKIEGIVELVSKRANEVVWTQLAGMLHEVFEMVYRL